MNDASLCAFFLNFCDDANAFFFHQPLLYSLVRIAIAIVADNDSS